MYGNSRHTTVIKLGEEVDWLSAPALRAQIETYLAHGVRSFAFDFTEVGYIDSAGVGMLLYVNRLITSHGGFSSLINVSQKIMRILALGKVLDYIPVTRTRRSLQEDPSVTDVRPEWIKILRVPDDPACMTDIRHKVSAILEPIGFSGDALYDLILAIGEALGNAFDHNITDKSPHIMITLSRYEDRVVAEITDKGMTFGLAKGELPEVSETRGRGIRLMHLLTDGVEIAPGGNRPNSGTRVRLIKLIS